VNDEREEGLMTATAGETLILDESLSDIDGLEAKASEYERMAVEYETKAEALRQIIAGVRALNGDAERVLMRRSFAAHGTAFETRPLDPNGPRGREAVLRVMRERPGRVWKVVEVKREMLRRGWAPTPKAVEASIAALRDAGSLEPAGYGHYRIPAESPDAQQGDQIEAVIPR
jgi:hypothetical protein